MRFRTPEGTSTCFFSPVERLSVAFLLNLAKRVAIAVQFADSISDPGLDKSFTSLRRSDARGWPLSGRLCTISLTTRHPIRFTSGSQIHNFFVRVRYAALRLRAGRLVRKSRARALDAMKNANSAMPATDYHGVIGHIACDARGDMKEGAITLYSDQDRTKSLPDIVKMRA